MENQKLCKLEKTPPCGIVIFGATGDLSHRKLFPSLYELYKNNLLSEDYFILGVGRKKLDDSEFRNSVSKSLKQNDEKFLNPVYYLSGDLMSQNFYTTLQKKINSIHSPKIFTLLFYFATYPGLYQPIIDNIRTSQIITKLNQEFKNIRFVVEKPYGANLDDAKNLDFAFHKFVNEKQIYRIDHYLGKETVQNILMFRFANKLFEPIWNNQHIDNIQITVSETLGVGHRAGYFDKTGLLRDMFQNHIMQMLALIAMEPPKSFDAEDIRNQKVKLMQCIKKSNQKSIQKHFIRAQYTSGRIDNIDVPAYRDEDGVPKNSNTETFLSGKLSINNKRWKNVPFYIRAGKRLKEKATYIVVVFKESVYSIVKNQKTNLHYNPNKLIIKIQPDEGFTLLIEAKTPGSKLCLSSIPLNFSYNQFFKQKMPDAYQRLLIDALYGDPTLFWRNDGIRVSWEIVNPLLEIWKEQKVPLYFYNAGTQGPKETDFLLKQDNRTWIDLE